jgi:hypothetical protein
MTLDLLKVGPQAAEMAQHAAERYRQFGSRLGEAQALLRRHAHEWEALRAIAEKARRRLPLPLEPLSLHASVGPVAPDHVVIGTDGSQIEPDRHGVADVFLLNIGWAVVRYGAEPFAELDSEPTLYYRPEDIYITYTWGNSQRYVPIQGPHLSAKRAGLELAKAASLVDAWHPSGLDLVALADGTLALWVLEERPDDFLRKALVKPYVDEMKRIRARNRPLASFISRPRSLDVAALLQEAFCVRGLDPCRACRSAGREPCVFNRLPDRDLFGMLAPGERSALFEMTLPEGLVEFYEDLVPRFCYLNVGSEIARIEVPPWTAADAALLDLVQAVVLDQCDKGLGYPNVLARADKQAVVTMQDRLAFGYLRDSLLAREGVPARASEKLHAKRVWAV